ncbi:MAG: hypothetical protein KA149_11780 [Chitinophagales bacterium]|nr:hypothetical protein [Chitinophagales bacterium]
MLYIEKLKQLEPEVEKVVDGFFKKIEKNQFHEGDLLLVAVHGFYDKRTDESIFLKKMKLSPYVFGSGEEGLTNQTQYDFYNAFLSAYVNYGDRQKYLEYLKTDKQAQASYLITLQLELVIYLKFWESDFFLKQLYNLGVNLLHGKNYDWHIDIKNKGKKTFLDIELKDSLRIKAPKFLELFDAIYSRQVRNAIAHSQFWLNNSYLILMNYDPSDNANLKRLTIDEWEEMYHLFVVFYNVFNRKIREFEKTCMQEAADKHFGKPVMLTARDKKTRIEFLKSLPEIPRWVWYKSWAKTNRPKIYIV